MTYLHRLAKRIAGLRPVVGLALLVGLACSKGEKVGIASPDSNPSHPAPALHTIHIEPLIASVRSGTEVQFTATGYSITGALVPVVVDWTAAGGDIKPDGRFTGGPAGQYAVVARVRNQNSIADSARVSVWENEHELVELIVFPDSAVVDEGDSLRATAALRLSNGDLTQEAEVVWSADGGSIDENGVFTAPVTGAYVVTAESPVGLRGRATVLVHRRSRRLEDISVDPPAATILRGGSASFTATARYDNGSSGPANVAWSATGGSISSSGQYVAGGVEGNYIVVARDRDADLADTAFVAVMTPSVVRLALSPKTLSIVPGATRQYSALAELSDATWQSVPLIWSASAGSITPSGAYTAPAAPGSYSVIATAPGLSVADTGHVTVTQPTATLTSLDVNPTSATLGVGEIRQFTASAQWSDGSTTTPVVTWTATGGSIGSSGLYVAGTSPGSFQVTAQVGAISATSTVVITTPVLSSLSLTPGSATVQASGEAVQFTVSGTWSDGGTGTPVVSWNVSGGNMTGTGNFHPGSTPGTFAIIATQQGGTLADTSFVTILSPNPTLNGLLLSPSTAVLAPGGSLNFTVIGSWSNGGTGAPSVTYTVTGGTMSGDRYTAGSTPGTYRVIAKHTYGPRADTSTVTITTPVTLTSLWISPDAPSVAPGAVQQFAVTATWSNGSTAVPLVNWTTNGGAVTTNGRYTAGATPGSFRVIAAHQGGSRRDTANVTVLGTPPPPPTPTLTSLTIAPDPVTVTPGAARQFTLSAAWSDGSTTVPAVTWTATGGTVSNAGLYTAGVPVGNYRVIATQQGGGTADTAAVTIAVGVPPVVTSLVVTPGNPSLPVGTSQGFSVLGNLSGGGTTAVSVTWTATGGTINSSGVFTAGMSGGSYQVRATLLGGALTNTSNVTLYVPSASGCGGGPNQPAGFAAVVARHFNSLGTTNPGTGYGNGRGTGPLPCMVGQSEGWDDIERTRPNIVLAQDPSSPLSPGGIMRMVYPAQGPINGTYSPGVSQMMGMSQAQAYYGTARHYQKVYFRTAFRVSANWQGHPTSTNKMFFVRSTNSPEPIIRLRGAGGNALTLNMDLQGSEGAGGDPRAGTGGLNPNTSGAGGAGANNIQRGRWYVLEGVLQIGNDDAHNGVLKLWLDGVLTHNYTDVEYQRDTFTGSLYWGYIHIAPTWGGGGGTINQTMYLDFDDFYVSGAP